MPVYLGVVSTSPRSATGGSHTLDGSQCLVFYLGGTAGFRPQHSGGMNLMMGDGSVRFAKDLDDIAAQLSRSPIAGSLVIIGAAGQPGYATSRWQLAPNSQQAPALGLIGAGGSAILVGLLLPAVQAAREAARRKQPTPAIQQLQRLVGLAGHVFVIDDTGALLRF